MKANLALALVAFFIGSFLGLFRGERAAESRIRQQMPSTTSSIALAWDNEISQLKKDGDGGYPTAVAMTNSESGLVQRLFYCAVEINRLRQQEENGKKALSLWRKCDTLDWQTQLLVVAVARNPNNEQQLHVRKLENSIEDLKLDYLK